MWRSSMAGSGGPEGQAPEFGYAPGRKQRTQSGLFLLLIFTFTFLGESHTLGCVEGLGSECDGDRDVKFPESLKTSFEKEKRRETMPKPLPRLGEELVKALWWSSPSEQRAQRAEEEITPET